MNGAYKKRCHIVRAIRNFFSRIALSGKLGETLTDLQVKHVKSASSIGIDDSLPGNAALQLVPFA